MFSWLWCPLHQLCEMSKKVHFEWKNKICFTHSIVQQTDSRLDVVRLVTQSRRTRDKCKNINKSCESNNKVGDSIQPKAKAKRMKNRNLKQIASRSRQHSTTNTLSTTRRNCECLCVCIAWISFLFEHEKRILLEFKCVSIRMHTSNGSMQ